MTFVTEWHLSYNANAFSRCSFEYISCSLSEHFKVQLFVRTPYPIRLHLAFSHVPHLCVHFVLEKNLVSPFHEA